MQGVRNLCGEGGEVEGGEVWGGKVSVTAKAVGEGIELVADVLGGEAYGVGEQGTGEEACKGEVRLGLNGRAGLGLVELTDGRRAVEEGEDARVGREDVGVMVEGHVEGDAVRDEFQVVIGKLPPVFRGMG